MTTQNRSDTFAIGDDLPVHRLGFGAMRVTGPDILGEPEDGERARTVLRRAVELGVDFVDTADAYGPGVSERLLRETLEPAERDDLVVATKGGLLRNPAGEWPTRGDPAHLRNAVLCSRDRLGVETIDLYQLHRPDPEVPIEDSMTALAELQDDGYLRHLGVSNVSVEQLDRARDVADVATVQNRYNVADRQYEPVLEACENYGIGFVPYFPVGAGNLEKEADALEDVAAAHDATTYQVALAWLLEHSPVTLPIPGTADPDHLAENVAASALDLTDEEYRRLAG